MDAKIINNIPILKYINKDNFLEKVESKNYPICLKKKDDLILFYNETDLFKDNQEDHKELFKNTKSVLINNSTLKPIYTQYNNIIGNKDALKELGKADWNNVVVEKSYEGTMLVLYYHNDKWNLSTRRCIDASNSKWIYGLSYYDMFMESIKTKFKLEDLNEKYCYHFVLVHYKNINIINYREFGPNYKEVIHTMTTEKDTCLEVNYTINKNVKTPEKLNYKNLDDLLVNLNSLSYTNEIDKKITSEGFVLKLYDTNERKGYFSLFKLQTELYIRISNIKPNNSNLNQCYLELYQKDLLQDILPFITSYHYDVLRRINFAFKTITREILNIYHNTRKKKNPFLYENLKETYKKVIYGLHGIYINNKKKLFQDSSIDENKFKSITIHNVYYYIKNLDSKVLRNLFLERVLMIKEGKILEFLNEDCIYCKTHTILMFGDILQNEIERESTQKTEVAV
jgi:hypothetical protein